MSSDSKTNRKSYIINSNRKTITKSLSIVMDINDKQMLTIIRISKAYPSVKALYTEAVYRDQKQKIYKKIAQISSTLADTFVGKPEKEFEDEL